MNKESNRDDETFDRRFLAWLFGESTETLPPFPPNRAAEFGNVTDAASDVEGASFESEPTTLGERLTVQHRFYALIKRRLQAEIEQNPPLFPWETELSEYAADVPDAAPSAAVPGRLWAAQLQNLRLPVPVPEAVLATLFDRCRDLADASVREGTKLVRAVESLFPERDDRLQQLAGVVLMGAARGEAGVLDAPPMDYETATPNQQMVLSLIAARELFGTLTLKVSADRPTDDRAWLTAAGQLTVTADYSAEDRSLQVSALLPVGGEVLLWGEDDRAAAGRPDAGRTSATLFDVERDRTYSLEVRLQHEDASALTFAIVVEE